MADNRWVAVQKKTKQIVTVQVTAYDAATTYKLTINSKSVTTIAQGSVNATASKLSSNWNDSTEGEHAEITASVATDTVTFTADTAGVPFTVTSSVSGGVGTIGAATTTTANTSPSDVNDGVNWSAGTTPANTEDVWIDGSVRTPLKYNLGSLSAITLTSLNIAANAPEIGLPYINQDGEAYTEYRPTDFAIGATTVRIGYGGASPSLSLCKLNYGAVANTTFVYATGSPSEDGQEAVTLRGTNAANVLHVIGGSVGVAMLGGQTSTIATINVGQAGDSGEPRLNLGVGCTLTTVSVDNGTLIARSAMTTLNLKGGTVKLNGTGAITTINQTAGTITHTGTGTVTTWNVTAATADLGEQGPAITVTNCKLWPAAQWLDKGYRGSYTNGLALQGGARLFGASGGDVLIDIGPGRTLTPS